MKLLRSGTQIAFAQAQYWRKQLNMRFSSLRSQRLSWWAHWAQLAENFLPRRYRWFVTPNQSNRGSQMNQNIIDETGLIAIRVLASGMLSGMTNPSKKWFKLGLVNKAQIEFGPVKIWLEQAERTLYQILNDSNFYQAQGVYYKDLSLFGSACKICYEDSKDVVRWYNPCLGEFFFWVDNRQVVEGMAREYTYTIYQTVAEFGLEAVSESTRQAYKQGGASLDREIIICHVIEPNDEVFAMEAVSMGYPVAKSFAYREVFWERGSTDSLILRSAGFNEKPFVGGRWDVTSNDPYGSSPGMDALPAVRQLQIEQKRKAEAIDKMVRPPMVGSVSMRNEPNSITPGAMNYVADMSQAGFKPAFLVDPRLAEMMEDIKEVQNRIKEICYNPLFLAITNLDTVRTATEIDARRAEQIVMLGPVIERDQNEDLDIDIMRVFAIAMRRGLIPPPPQELAGETLQVQYVSMLAQAQQAAVTAAIERIFAVAGNLAGVSPDIMDKLDTDESIEYYADALNLPPKIVRSAIQVMKIRAQRAQQQQMAQAVEASKAAPNLANAAKNLSETDLGGGQSALQRMIQ